MYINTFDQKEHLIKSYDTVWILMAFFFSQKVLIFFYFSVKNICCGNSLEALH